MSNCTHIEKLADGSCPRCVQGPGIGGGFVWPTTDAYHAALDTIADWQEATGLMAGGDPGGVTPEMLRRFIRATDEVVRIAERLSGQAQLTFCADRRYQVPEADVLALREALATLRKGWPEQ